MAPASSAGFFFAGKRSGAMMIELFTYETPNGQKASIMLEEVELPYVVRTVDLMKDIFEIGMAFTRLYRSAARHSLSL